MGESDRVVSKENILEFLPLVKKVVSRIFPGLPPQLMDFEDLVGYGIVGLIEAVDTFNPHRGVKFSTYAFYRIRGAILDTLRALDWLPRELRRKIHLVENAADELTQELGREPTEKEVADKIGMSESEVNSLLMDAYQSEVFSLEDTLHNYLAHKTDNFLNLDELENLDLKEIIAAALDELPQREKLVLTLYYYEELNLKEIGKVLDLSESRVSQILKKAVKCLQERLHHVGGEL